MGPASPTRLGDKLGNRYLLPPTRLRRLGPVVGEGVVQRYAKPNGETLRCSRATVIGRQLDEVLMASLAKSLGAIRGRYVAVVDHQVILPPQLISWLEREPFLRSDHLYVAVAWRSAQTHPNRTSGAALNSSYLFCDGACPQPFPVCGLPGRRQSELCSDRLVTSGLKLVDRRSVSTLRMRIVVESDCAWAQHNGSEGPDTFRIPSFGSIKAPDAEADSVFLRVFEWFACWMSSDATT